MIDPRKTARLMRLMGHTRSIIVEVTGFGADQDPVDLAAWRAWRNSNPIEAKRLLTAIAAAFDERRPARRYA